MNGRLEAEDGFLGRAYALQGDTAKAWVACNDYVTLKDQSTVAS